jgi:alkylhydroperoxidase family enzyme
MLTWIMGRVVARAERRIGVELDYARKISHTDIGLMMRYGKIFGFLDPNRNVPADAYHVARLRGAVSADCGTCVAAEINLAKAAGVSPACISAVLQGDYAALGDDLRAVACLANAVTGQRVDDPVARAGVVRAHGEVGLIELSFAMNGAALLPGIKRAMGYATTCDLTILRQLV